MEEDKREILKKVIVNLLNESKTRIPMTRMTTLEQCRDYIKRHGLLSAVGNGFTWSASPEGGKYWSDVYDSLAERHYGLLMKGK